MAIRKKSLKAPSKSTVWKAVIFSVFVFPSVFILLKQNSSTSQIGISPLFFADKPKPSKNKVIFPQTLPNLETSSDALEERLAFTCQNEESISIEQIDEIPLNHNTTVPLTNVEEEESFSNYSSIVIEETIQETPLLPVVNSLWLNSRLEIGGDYTHFNLKPHQNPSFTGNLGGIQALYEYRPMNRFYGSGVFSWKEGSSHGSSGTRSLLYFDVQERLGYTFAPEANDWFISLFSGFGYRYFGQTLSQKEESSIQFGYNEFYFPVGFLTNYEITSWLSLGIDFTWMAQVYSTVSIKPLKGARWDLTNELTNFFVKIPFTFSLTKNKRFQMILTPFYERWEDGHSTATLSNGTALGLPGNTYNFYGVDLNFGFCF